MRGLKSNMSIFEESSFYEIIELENGDIVLQRSDNKEEEPLVTVHFSKMSEEYLGAARFEVAKVMIEAGLDAVADLVEHDGSEEFIEHSNLLH